MADMTKEDAAFTIDFLASAIGRLSKVARRSRGDMVDTSLIIADMQGAMGAMGLDTLDQRESSIQAARRIKGA